MPFTFRLFRRSPVQCSVRCYAGPLFTLPLAYVLDLGSPFTRACLCYGINNPKFPPVRLETAAVE